MTFLECYNNLFRPPSPQNFPLPRLIYSWGVFQFRQRLRTCRGSVALGVPIPRQPSFQTRRIFSLSCWWPMVARRSRKAGLFLATRCKPSPDRTSLALPFRISATAGLLRTQSASLSPYQLHHLFYDVFTDGGTVHDSTSNSRHHHVPMLCRLLDKHCGGAQI